MLYKIEKLERKINALPIDKIVPFSDVVVDGIE